MSEDALWEDTGSIFRPSYAATWANCAGALLPSRYAADNAGEDAAIGTVFHIVMGEWQTVGRPDHLLNTVFDVEKEDGSETFHVLIDEDMFIHGQECLDRYAHIPGVRYVETKVDISSVTPISGQYGTADLAICSKGELDIIDWKYGKGVQVFAKWNLQILLYAWGFFVEYDKVYHFQNIRLHIAQPRFNHFDVWEITREELIDFSDWIRVRAREAWKRNAPRTVSGKACQWCKVRTTCVALEAARQSLADLTFDAIEEPVTVSAQKALSVVPVRRLPPAVELTTADLLKIAVYSKLFESWFADVREELTTRAINGEDVSEFFKLVEGRTRRAWKNEGRAAAQLMLLGLDESELYERKLVSPAQAQKLLRTVGVRGNLAKDFVNSLARKPPGRPTLAPAGDSRLALESPVDDVFEVEDEREDAL